MFYLYIVDCFRTPEWSAWEACPVSCNGGIQARFRNITIMEQNAGNPCDGHDTELQTCNSFACPPGELISVIQHKAGAMTSLILT